MLPYECLRTMAVLCNPAALFTAIGAGTRSKLDIFATHPITAAKRLFGIPNFRLDALADGIRAICARFPQAGTTGANATLQLTLGCP